MSTPKPLTKEYESVYNRANSIGKKMGAIDEISTLMQILESRIELKNDELSSLLGDIDIKVKVEPPPKSPIEEFSEVVDRHGQFLDEFGSRLEKIEDQFKQINEQLFKLTQDT
jgi:hypothetical protein